jgi:pimeloyl-ACP methyl ester carboxylesterase
MFFDTYGDNEKPTLVLLHGAAALDTFANQYQALSRWFHVLVPHLPGAGEAAQEPYDPRQTCDALAEWIASLGAGRVYLMGHSVGAELAVRLVSEHEALFCRAVFLSPWLNATPASIRLYASMARMTYRSLKNAGLLRMQAKYWHFSDGQTARLIDYSAKIPLETYTAFFEKRTMLTGLAGYPGVSIPMLAMCARGDTGETKASVRALGEQNTNCLTVVFPQGSHDFVLRSAALLNPLLLDFLTQELPAASPATQGSAQTE